MATHINGTLKWILLAFFSWVLGFAGPIYTNLYQPRNEHFAATFEVVVGTDGKVVSAQTATGFIGDLTLLCKTWEYKPFERNGHLVAAKVRESVSILPIGERPEVHVAFPEIHDWNSLRITLGRSRCYGMCPTYEIEIHGTERSYMTARRTSAP